MERISKDRYYLSIAEMAARAEHLSAPVLGAIIVNNDEIVSTGYNGAPRGEMNCCDCGYCEREAKGVPKGERYELCVAVHAEQNAIISASRREMDGGTIYIVGIDAKDGSYANPTPCLICRRLIVNAGITRCVGLVDGEAQDVPLHRPD